ncbi:MAG TPA: HAD family acid phosphatase [Nocardioides sp.]|uniref:HAD family acid phosphatase n=1 Tax=Nocardioides sp. TaxID=35761 RepID=UPI002E348A95|nr:HAD family acid phosphatase [Nocardioides sp.]HEX3930448.1 HAD family acid phosphatase [Nocardioides sp.]
MKSPFHLSKSAARTTTVAIASAAATAALTIPGLALAHGGHGHGGAVPAPPTNPTSDSQIQNIDQVKTAIKAYYGDTLTTTPDPVDASTMLHQFSADGAYAHQTERIAARAGHFLAHRAHHAKGHKHGHGRPAVVFDIDDTTLNTYSYEIYSSFVYDPASNAAFVNAGSASVFPAVPGMPALERKAIKKGYTVFFLTGRPITQLTGTEANLTDAGYTYDAADLYLKDASGATEPWLSSCAPSCTTVQYKSLTRQHIESLGYRIVANLGDQFSDLEGGFAKHTVKMPNPMYFLP